MFIKCLLKWLRDFFYLVTTAEQGYGEKRSSALLDHFFSVFSTPVFRLFRSFQHFPQRIPLPTLFFFARGSVSMLKNLFRCLIPSLVTPVGAYLVHCGIAFPLLSAPGAETRLFRRLALAPLCTFSTTLHPGVLRSLASNLFPQVGFRDMVILCTRCHI